MSETCNNNSSFLQVRMNETCHSSSFLQVQESLSNRCQVETLRNRSFYNLSIACIVIYENRFLTTLEENAFEGLVGLQVLVGPIFCLKFVIY